MKTESANDRGLSCNDECSNDELFELHDRIVERVRNMSLKEGFDSLVASGIYTPDGKLAKEYGG